MHKIIPIVFATNDNYAKFVPVTIYSILANSSSEFTYEFYIFHSGLAQASQDLIKNNQAYRQFANYAINFVNVSRYIESAGFYAQERFSAEMWFRLLIPEILHKYDKVLYLDCDLIAQKNIADLFKTDLGNNCIAAVRNFVGTKPKDIKRICKLGVKPEKYFNSGVLLFNVKMCNEFGLKNKCLNTLNAMKGLDYPDQDVLNIVCKNHTLLLDAKWNCTWHLLLYQARLSKNEKFEYANALRNPAVIHYTSALKPWNYAFLPFADLWWKYALKTGLFDYDKAKQINEQNVPQAVCYKLFKILPLFSLKKTADKITYRLFNIPVFKIVKKAENLRQYYLFNIMIFNDENVKNNFSTTEVISVKNTAELGNTEAKFVIKNKLKIRPKVSVIIPVYNTAKYLRQCLDSVVNQTLKNIEIICVDDGSSDNSLEILKEYALKDKRISVLMQQNLLAGIARNAGLMIARGKYIHFLDSDDRILPDMYLQMVRSMECNKVDLVVCGIDYLYESDEARKIRKGPANRLSFSALLNIKDVSKLLINSEIWNKLYKADIIKAKKIFFLNTHYAEDTAFNTEYLLSSKKCYFMEQKYYIYRVSENSLMGKLINRQQEYDGIKTKEHLCKIICTDEKLYKENKQDFLRSLYFQLKWIYRFFDSKDKRIKLLEYYREHVLLYFNKQDLESISLFLMIYNQQYEDALTDLYSTKSVTVSVIIPVYNTAKYLRQCLDSVVNQTLKDIEIICIDDGSTDNSFEILKEYEAKDMRIKIMKQANCGLSATRNRGINMASADLLYFLDSDDWIEPDTLEKAVKQMTADVDFVCWGSKIVAEEGVTPNNGTLEYHKIKKTGLLEIDDNLILSLNKVVCNKLFKKDIIKNNQIMFSVGRLFEDNDFVIKYFLNARKIYIINEYLHNYRQRSASIMNTVFTGRCRRMVDVAYVTDSLYKYFDEHNLLERGMNILTRTFGGNVKFISYYVPEKQFDSVFSEITDMVEGYKPQVRDALKQYKGFFEKTEYKLFKFIPIYSIIEYQNKKYIKIMGIWLKKLK